MSPVTRSNLLLMMSAVIWGFAFVAQRLGMEHVGPFTFNAVRFALGGLVLIPVLRWREKSGRASPKNGFPADRKRDLFGGCLAGLVVFAGASFQQLGLVDTTAGKAGFITGLYVILVPMLGLLGGQRSGWGTWIGAVFAVWGLYFLCITTGWHIGWGDLLVLFGAFFWAVHVHLINWQISKMDAIRLAMIQFTTCSVLSFITAFFTEEITWQGLQLAAVPILYAGLLSVGVAYTLQVVAQREAHPAHAAIILSLEAVFAALGGFLILRESLTSRGILGCALMLTGMLLSQLTIRSLRRGPRVRGRA